MDEGTWAIKERAPYGRESKTESPLPAVGSNGGSPYAGESYHDQPAIKPSHYGTLIASYFFTGGLAGAAQLIGTLAELRGRKKDRPIVQAGRYLALLGACLGPAFLIKDLRTPERWYNMLRIFRPTSMMSIGAWTISAFGATSALTAGAQLLSERTGKTSHRRLARWIGIPAAALGSMMATYTGALLSATSNPLWASVYRLLPALFGASATATSTAALSLTLGSVAGSESARRGLEKVGLVAGGAELLLSHAMERKWQHDQLPAPSDEKSVASMYKLSKALGVVAPLAIHAATQLSGRRSRSLSMLAAVATLAGGYLLRSALLSAGNAAAEHPRDYFRFTQP